MRTAKKNLRKRAQSKQFFAKIPVSSQKTHPTLLWLPWKIDAGYDTIKKTDAVTPHPHQTAATAR